MNADFIFSEYKEITAFFSFKPEKTAVLIPNLAKSLPEGEYFIKPWMVHGKHIQVIDRDFLNAEHVPVQGYPELVGARGYVEVPETDGLVTNLPGVALVTTHGDCIPVWAYDPILKVAGVAHAGWKGTMFGIAGELVRTMKDLYDCDPANIAAYIGPGIDKCCFEVKDDVRQQFLENVPNAERFISQKDAEHYLIDLKGINKQFIEMQGVTNITISPDCTSCLNDKYWSYRKTKEKDRMLAYIKINKE